MTQQHDLAIGANINTPGGAVAILPTGASISKKPPYLVLLERNDAKTIVVERFISLGKPQFDNGFIEVKGYFSDRSEDEIIKSYNDIISSTSKESIVEMMFPLHRIISIRSLIFSAVKSMTPR